MSDEYLQTESDCNSIANAIRDRNSEPSTTKYKHRDFDDKVDKLPNLIPSLSLSSDKTVSSGSVTLSAELSANEVLSGADEQSVYGKLQNAIVKFYKQGETVPLSSSITNKNGVANTTVTITEDTTFISQFEHKIPFDSATSNTVTVEYEAPTYLFYDTGVTGTANDNYTIMEDATRTVTDNGTIIGGGTTGDCYVRANPLISGDFSIKFHLVTKTGGYEPSIAFFDTSLNRISVQEPNGNSWNGHTIVNNEDYKIERIGTSLKVYINNSQIASSTITSDDIYMAWKVYKDGRSLTFTNLIIEEV